MISRKNNTSIYKKVIKSTFITITVNQKLHTKTAIFYVCEGYHGNYKYLKALNIALV